MKLNIDKNLIANLASDSQKYSKGKNLFLADGISDMDCFVENKVKTFTAKIFDDDVIFESVLKFDFSGNIKNYSCDCEFKDGFKGACEHVTSLLFYIQDENTSSLSRREENLIAQNLVEEFKKDLFQSKNKDIEMDVDNKIKIVPVFKLDFQNHLKVGFKMGTNKYYRIKNLREFLDNIEQENYDTYGKGMAFKHNKNKFTKESREIINILIEENPTFEKEITLSSDNFEKLFDIVLEHGCEGASVAISEKPITFTMEIMDTCITIKDYEKKYALIQGNDFDFIFMEEVLYRVDKEYFKTIHNLKSSMDKSKKNTLYFYGDKIKGFLKYAYIFLVEHNVLENNYKSELEAFGVFPLVSKLYFDAEGKNLICKVVFSYGEIILSPSEENDKVVFRDLSLENEILNKLLFFGFEKNSRNDFVLIKEDDIFDFYNKGVAEIKKLSEVYATSKFRTQSRIKRDSKTNMDIRLKGDLLNIKVENNNFTFAELIDALTSFKIRKKYHRLKNGNFINFDDESVLETMQMLSALDKLNELDDLDLDLDEIVINKNKAIFIDNLVTPKDNFNISKDKHYKELITQIDDYKNSEFAIPSGMENILRDYQKDGFQWLKNLADFGFGGILADDMGLGKTLQVIALLLDEQKADDKKCIIVCPTSLVYNWKNEMIRFAPSLKVDLIIGNQEYRIEKLKNSQGSEILITTYDILKRDIKFYKDIEFKYVIIDEAQYIKNPATQSSKAVKKLKKDIGFALTGTPIENSLTELWSIFDFVMKGYLKNLKYFQANFNKEIVEVEDSRRKDLLKNLIRPFILRRVKKDVLDELPDKIETNLYSDMTSEQTLIYSSYFMEAKGEITDILDDSFYKKNNNAINIISKLTRLRQLACHPSLFLDDYVGGSGKLDATLEIIENTLENNNRILLFSQFTTMLEIIKKVLDAKKIDYFYLDGKVKSKDREKMTEQFNNGEKEIFLISLKAGGTGLNLTGANVVIHFDPWWNPAVMDQATDRAHRFGQKSTVQVFNMIAKNTIEEKIFQLQGRKKSLIDSVIENGGGTGILSKMSKDDIQFIFSDWA